MLEVDGYDGMWSGELNQDPFLPLAVAAELTDRIELGTSIAVLRGRLAFYASTPAYRGIFELHGWDGVNEELTVLSKAGRWADMAGLITDDMVDAFAVVATPDELPGRVVERFGAILTRMSLSLSADLDREAAADLVRRIRLG